MDPKINRPPATYTVLYKAMTTELKHVVNGQHNNSREKVREIFPARGSDRLTYLALFKAQFTSSHSGTEKRKGARGGVPQDDVALPSPPTPPPDPTSAVPFLHCLEDINQSTSPTKPPVRLISRTFLLLQYCISPWRRPSNVIKISIVLVHVGRTGHSRPNDLQSGPASRAHKP